LKVKNHDFGEQVFSSDICQLSQTSKLSKNLSKNVKRAKMLLVTLKTRLTAKYVVF